MFVVMFIMVFNGSTSATNITSFESIKACETAKPIVEQTLKELSHGTLFPAVFISCKEISRY